MEAIIAFEQSLETMVELSTNLDAAYADRKDNGE